MPGVDATRIDLGELCLTDVASRQRVPLAALSGVHVLVLTRHRH